MTAKALTGSKPQRCDKPILVSLGHEKRAQQQRQSRKEKNRDGPQRDHQAHCARSVTLSSDGDPPPPRLDGRRRVYPSAGPCARSVGHPLRRRRPSSPSSSSPRWPADIHRLPWSEVFPEGLGRFNFQFQVSHHIILSYLLPRHHTHTNHPLLLTTQPNPTQPIQPCTP